MPVVEKTVPEIVNEIEKRMRKQSFEMEEAARESPDSWSSIFRWHKSSYETLECLLAFIDPKNSMLNEIVIDNTE